MDTQRTQQITEEIAHMAAAFLGRESNRQSLITVTRADISPDRHKSTVYFVVLPESEEAAALDFTKRKRGDFRDFVKRNSRMRIIPFFDFAIDMGEKARQHLDEISNTV